MKHTQLTRVINNLKCNAMNKTLNTILKILSYVITALLAAAGEAQVML